MSPESCPFLLLFSGTCCLQHFLPVHHETFKPAPAVSHGDVPEELSHMPVTVPLLFHPSASREKHCPGSILGIKAEECLSLEAELPGCSCAPIGSPLTQHPALQRERVCPPPPSWDRGQPLVWTNPLPPPHSIVRPLGPFASIPLSPSRPTLPAGLLRNDQHPFSFFF